MRDAQMINRDKDFAQLIEQIDSHVFTGDTLLNATNLQRLRVHITRWNTAIKEQERQNEIISQDSENEATIIHYYKVHSTKLKCVYFESDRTFNHPHSVMMKCRQEELFDAVDEVESFTEISQKEYFDSVI